MDKKKNSKAVKKWRANQRALGLVPVEVWVPSECADWIKFKAKELAARTT